MPLVAPTTPDERLAEIGASARGFLYTVSLTGTTGERASLDGGLPAVISRAAAHTTVPVAVGFGIGTPEQVAAAAAAGADGVIIGSRLVRAAGEAADPAAAVSELVRSFAAALVVASRSNGTDPHRHRRPVHLDRPVGDHIFGGFDAILIAIVMVLIAIAVRNLLPSCLAGGTEISSGR